MLTRSNLKRLFIAITLLATPCLVGCTDSSSGSPTAEGRAMLLEAEPADPSSVVDMKSAIMMGAVSVDSPAILVGKVLGGQDWETDQASFLIRDLAAEAADAENGHAHTDGDHSDCVFCQAKKKKDLESLALVQIVNEEGALVGSDARKLLGLKENDIVVAQGSGQLEEDGTLVFSAAKIFIR